MSDNHNKAWYALRRTLPIWSANENLEELIEFSKRNHIDEIIVKVDAEEFTHGIPSLKWLDDYLPVLKKIKAGLEGAGIKFSINPWVTLVHCDRGRKVKEIYPDIGLMVGHDGVQCTSCACPLSEGWRKVTKALWQRYASTHPEVLWVEDDIRLLNHQPAAYGCFCDIHMKEFRKKVGKTVSREELVAALFAPGEPHPYRKIWFDLNRDAMIDTVGFLEKCVHEISPETKLGLMCSPPTAHAIEGRDWDGLTSALAGNNKLVARPCMLNYDESSPRGLYGSEYMMKVTLHCLSPETIIQTEIENWPFSGFSKSAKFTFLQCALSFLLGADGVTMNLFDHMGNPMMDVDPNMGDMLRNKKTYLNAIAERCNSGKSVGIQLLHDQKGSYSVKLGENAGLYDLSPNGHAWHSVFGPFGFSYTFEKSDVVALSGQVVRSLNDEQIKNILSKGALIDLSAMKCLIDMGYGDLLGASIKKTIHKYDEPLAAEEYFNTDFGGAKNMYLTNTLPHLGGNPEIAEFELAYGAILVSHIVDPDNVARYPFLTLYENKLGGRTALYPVDIEYMSTGKAFLSPYRKIQMKNVLNWLSRGNIAMEVESGPYPLSLRIDKDDEIILAAFNLTLDDWPKMAFNLSTDRKINGHVQILQEDGTWKSEETTTITQSDGKVRVELNKPIKAVSLVVVALS